MVSIENEILEPVSYGDGGGSRIIWGLRGGLP
jgi:hypothetical protein